jgi:hypothetical protein
VLTELSLLLAVNNTKILLQASKAIDLVERIKITHIGLWQIEINVKNKTIIKHFKIFQNKYIWKQQRKISATCIGKLQKE